MFSRCFQGVFRVFFPMPFPGMPFGPFQKPPDSSSSERASKRKPLASPSEAQFPLVGASKKEGFRICVKWVPFVKLAFSLGNRAHFGSKMGLFSAFSHYVFNDCGPNRGFHSDFALSPILTL